MVTDEPLVGLKRASVRGQPCGRTVTDEPLVGLKLTLPRQEPRPRLVTDEPLVGLKLFLVPRRRSDRLGYRRTPCGVEASMPAAS